MLCAHEYSKTEKKKKNGRLTASARRAISGDWKRDVAYFVKALLVPQSNFILREQFLETCRQATRRKSLILGSIS